MIAIEELAARVIDEDKLHPVAAIEMAIDSTRNRDRFPGFAAIKAA